MIWIRSQNKELLIEVDNLCIINKCFDSGTLKSVSIYSDKEDECYELGKYSNLEKAMRVMDMIHSTIINNECAKADLLSGYKPVFEMPAEEEVTV